jgi:hypothetical protein
MTLAGIARAAAAHHLAVFGGFHPGPGDAVPAGTGTLILLGPDEPGFWDHVTGQPEWQGGAPDPLDRWSARVIGGIAAAAGGTALFPFGGPPYHPFYQWALRTGRAFASPVTLLVHDRAGLMASWRGALALPGAHDLPAPPARSPCEDCPGQPCRSACPVAALGPAGYDLAACHGFLDSAAGADCLSCGCAVRRACPLSRAYGRLPRQSAYHMRLFHK